MKYLIKHKKEFMITIVWFCVLAYCLYDGFKNGREPQSLIETVFGLLVWYFNMPTSVEGDTSKALIKEMKSKRLETVDDNEEPDDAEVE